MSNQSRNQGREVRQAWAILSGTRHFIDQSVAWIRRRLPGQGGLTFSDRYQPGLFVIDSPSMARQIATEAEAAGLVVARIEGSAVTTKVEFLSTAAGALSFPGYFGQNWDAFADCIGDLGWLPGPGYVFLFEHFDQFAATDPRNWGVALTILRRAAAGWASTGTPMYIFLRMSDWDEPADGSRTSRTPAAAGSAREPSS
jgi:hypothetical protein